MKKLKVYDIKLDDEIYHTFVAESMDKAMEIAKALYYVDMADHWLWVQENEEDHHVFTLDNINFCNGDQGYWVVERNETMKTYEVIHIDNGSSFKLVAENDEQALISAKKEIARRYYDGISFDLDELDIEYDMNHRIVEL